jgi:hypothetical protein
MALEISDGSAGKAAIDDGMVAIVGGSGVPFTMLSPSTTTEPSGARLMASLTA